MDNQEFYSFFVSDIMADASVNSSMTEEIFIEKMCNFLVDEAVLPNYEILMHKSDDVKLDAWHLEIDEGKLYFIISDFYFSSEMPILNQDKVDKIIKKAKRFYSQIKKKKNVDEIIDITHRAYSAAKTIISNYDKIKRLNIIVVTNAKQGDRVKIKSEEANNVVIDCDLWDISRIQRVEQSGAGREDIDIEIEKFGIKGLPYLEASSAGNNTFLSYLAVVPGSVLYGLYDKYGERLLEQNVRTFLQFKGGANKGIRNTIINTPEMFFCYNNGITTTAEDVYFSDDGKCITGLKNLQIVNGGQTTASIFTVKRNEDKKVDLTKLFVQMKLTIVPQEKVDDVVPNISQYANTQNKVNAADFSSNHPFHRRIEDFSRRLLFRSPGNSIDIHWFYERSRGQYINAFARLSSSDERKFLLLHPKTHMFTKTDLAKAIYSFDQKPHIVSKGAQTCYQEFAKEMMKSWTQDPDGKVYNERYFKELVAKLLFFNMLDKIVGKENWYQGYKANIVTYSLAYLMMIVNKTGRFIDFPKVCTTQEIPEPYLRYLLHIAKDINDLLQKRSENVTQFCKQEFCWQEIQGKITVELPAEVKNLLVHKDVVEQEHTEAVRTQKIQNRINEQVEVINKGNAYWQSVLDFLVTNNLLASPDFHSILTVATLIPRKLPSEPQCRVILKLEQLAVNEGFIVK